MSSHPLSQLGQSFSQPAISIILSVSQVSLSIIQPGQSSSASSHAFSQPSQSSSLPAVNLSASWISNLCSRAGVPHFSLESTSFVFKKEINCSAFHSTV
jgi:hypothetical protein